MGRPIDFLLDLGPDQRRFFADEGYLRIDRISTDDEIEWLREVYDQLFAQRIGEEDGRFVTCPVPGGAPMQQVLRPEKDRPELLSTTLVTNARRLAAELLGLPGEQLSGEGHLVYKPPGCGRETPWHQDSGYCTDPFNDYDSISVWVPLDDATEESGCMAFIPGSHKEDHPHRRMEEGSYILVVDQVSPREAVVCPLPAGGATIHNARTVHYAGPNRTAEPRRVYVNVFDAPPVKRAAPASRPWLELTPTSRDSV